MMWNNVFLSNIFFHLILAIPSFKHNALHYHTLLARDQNLPLLKLPYGTWQASKYDSTNDIYVFTNIRFAAPPVGALRFSKPAPPSPVTTLQKGDKGGSCTQAISPSMLRNILEKNAGTTLANAIGPLAGGAASSIDIAKMQGSPASSEDCLFLDLYVPGKAMRREAKLPVVNWIYGGAYITGTKDGVYDGSAIVNSSGGNVIYVGGNYRLGAFGFLGGITAEKEDATNAGLHDQRAVLKWVQDYIHLVGGDPGNVSLWGESAGGGSVLHHLVAYGGKAPPLFSKAVVMSPAIAPSFDRPGSVEQEFQEFASLAGCAGQGIPCLRNASWATLQTAQDKFIKNASLGTFGFGPSADGTLIRQSPTLELASGNFVKNLQSLIITHVSDEGKMFSNGVSSDATFNSIIEQAYGNSSAVKDAILKVLPSPSQASNSKYATQKSRMGAYMQFSTFSCHTRYLAEAFNRNQAKTYMLQYAHTDGGHGSDLLALFPPTGRFGFSMLSLQFGASDPPTNNFTSLYRTYLTSYTRSGDPNTFKKEGTPEWPVIEEGPTFRNVLEAGKNAFSLVEDKANTTPDCEVWRDSMAAVTNAKGLAPPDGVVKQNNIQIQATASSPSANFRAT